MQSSLCGEENSVNKPRSATTPTRCHVDVDEPLEDENTNTSSDGRVRGTTSPLSPEDEANGVSARALLLFVSSLNTGHTSTPPLL
jgi:hypothetical protein